MSDAQITLGGLVRAIGLPVSLVCLGCVIAGGVLLIRGYVAKRRGDLTERHHWWLTTLTRAVLLLGAAQYVFDVVGVVNELVRRSNEVGSSKGAGDFLLIQAAQHTVTLLPVLVTGLLLTVCALVLGSPRRGPEVNLDADLPAE